MFAGNNDADRLLRVLGARIGHKRYIIASCGKSTHRLQGFEAVHPKPEAAEKMRRQNDRHQRLPDAHCHRAHLSRHYGGITECIGITQCVGGTDARPAGGETTVVPPHSQGIQGVQIQLLLLLFTH